MALTSAQLHYSIINDVVANGRAPHLSVLASRYQVMPEEMQKGLRQLADDRGVVLHPDNDEIWAIHPFSLAPTNFTVRAGAKVWWGNCAWCSLGIAALIGGEVTISSTLGGEGQPVSVTVRDGTVEDSNLVVHFPIPMQRIWNNVIYSCSTMLFFESETEVRSWCFRHGIVIGDVRSIDTVARFAGDWYERHRDKDWQKWTVAEARELFARHGLSGQIWELPDGDDTRF
ncbi:MAG: alkylmercury lyase family protein [Alphaproteobacteria bacterium]|nr:alkylmercury lyase family protein [Alphaproteobacteria bacterium]